ncbi:hypothetical protein FF1_038756 [Malus domestica]
MCFSDLHMWPEYYLSQTHVEVLYIVRELRVLWDCCSSSWVDSDKLQHQDYGTLLMEEAERFASPEHR